MNAARLAGAYIYGVMYIYGGDIVQDRSVLILYLTGSVSITAVILVGITVHYYLRRCLYNGSCNRLNRSNRS
jgi:hypothetical protein